MPASFRNILRPGLTFSYCYQRRMSLASKAALAVPKDRANLLDRAWSEAAQLYLQELVPRFDPWLQSALVELRQHELPAGPIIVPCCGPGHEVVLLHQLYGGRRTVLGLDLSQGMVALAKQAIQDYLQQQQQLQQRDRGAGGAAAVAAAAEPVVPATPLDARVADASCLDGYGPAAAVVSVFGLQQMGPLAPQALASWARCLAPGGLAVVVLWPTNVERSGPWVTFDQVVLEKAAADAGLPPPAPDAAACSPRSEWEVQLTQPCVREVPGVELLTDRLVTHPIEWDSLNNFWQVMTEGGPWRARRLAQGEEVMSDLRNRFFSKLIAACGDAGSQEPLLREAPHHLQREPGQHQEQQGQQQQRNQQQQQQEGGRLVHHPSARLIVLRRRREEGLQQEQLEQKEAVAGDQQWQEHGSGGGGGGAELEGRANRLSTVAVKL
ncbi:hypothetical protein Agub_g13570 [Astrephomene gubernaculifera]|uniref:Methyltransferase domain-containing protein n=1 Tax=Astrephomene gubernaculifera TaxID=47775 RepID=A0AAD3E2R1_9CHLO|nr:hypothetical protein Agub_g13570 [Astrephomene gubernaculifera]